MNIDDAFDRLRRANPVVGDVGAPPIDDVLERLGDLPAAAIFRRRRAGAASLISLSAGVVLVVVVGALLLSGHSRSSTTAGSGVPSRAHQLISILAVLRRPQTPSDRGVPWRADEVARRIDDQPVPTLTRRVFTFPNGRGLFLVVVTHPTAFGAPPPLPARLGDGVALWSLCCNGPAEPALSLRLHKQLLPEERGVPHAHARYYAYSVVPDGVARVKWVFASLRSPTHTWPQTTVWAKAQNNVAVAAVLPIPRSVLAATWYAADGRIIAARRWTRNRHYCQRHPNSCQSYL